MRIALVGGGMLSVPPRGWGAVEVLLDGYRDHLELAGHHVDLYNSIWFNETIVALRKRAYDFIHLHNDLHCGAFNRHLGKPYCVTSHYGGFGRFVQNEADQEYAILFRDTLAAPGNLVFSAPIQGLYERHGYAGFLRVLENPVDVRRFAFSSSGNGRAICLGRIQPRKRQVMLARVATGRVPVDFVGPYDASEEPDFEPGDPCRYLGEWDRQTVYQRLTDYSCLVLLSKSEGDALVVKEALAAGLSVVVTESSRGSLPANEFVTVLNDNDADPPYIAGAIGAAVASNTPLREGIRDFALRRFDYDALLKDYINGIESFHAFIRATGR